MQIIKITNKIKNYNLVQLKNSIIQIKNNLKKKFIIPINTKLNIKGLCATDEACALVSTSFFSIGMTLLQILNLPIDILSIFIISNGLYKFTNRILFFFQSFLTGLTIISVFNAKRLDLWWIIVYNTLWLLKNIYMIIR